MTIAEFKKNASDSLASFLTASLDVQVLLSHCLNLDKTQILLQSNLDIPEDKLEWLNSAIQKRKQGIPIAYITGKKEFYGYAFFVTKDVLIPKPDTEILVENAIKIILEKIEARKNQIITICDMCTGSGCVGISILKTLVEKYKIPVSVLPKITLVDISDSALEIARKNVAHLLQKNELLERIRFIRSNLFEQVTGSFDVIVSNPPYIPHEMVDELLKDGRSEPRLALDGDITLTGERSLDNDGLEIIRNLIMQAINHLSPKGTVLLETGEYNAKATSFFAQRFGLKTKIYKDLEGQLRNVEMHY